MIKISTYLNRSIKIRHSTLTAWKPDKQRTQSSLRHKTTGLGAHTASSHLSLRHHRRRNTRVSSSAAGIRSIFITRLHFIALGFVLKVPGSHILPLLRWEHHCHHDLWRQTPQATKEQLLRNPSGPILDRTLVPSVCDCQLRKGLPMLAISQLLYHQGQH